MLFRHAARVRRAPRRRLARHSTTLRGRLETLEERTLLTGIALDPTFGTGGLVRTDQIGVSSDAATSIAIAQPDGKIIVAGNANQPNVGDHFLLARYTADGSLDTSFGNGGFVTTTQGYNWNADAMALDASGHIVVVGNANTDVAGNEAIVAMYNSDGSLDSSFGTGGIVANLFGGSLSFLNGVAIDPAGNIDVVGQVYHHTQNSNSYQLLLARLAPDGSFDAAFDNAASAAVQSTFGTAVTDGFAVAIDANGNLAIAGQLGPGANGSRALVARFTNNGAIDPTFNITGYATTSFGTTSIANVANAVDFDANHQIVIAGHTGSDQFHAGQLGVERYTTTGTPDASFGTNGIATKSGLDVAYGLAIDAAGNILVAAQMRLSAFAALRFTPSGTPDTSFGTSGESDVGFGASYVKNAASAVTLTSTGQILLAGTAQDTTNLQHVALARLNGNGTLDGSFGSDQNGTVLSSFQISVLNGARAMAIQSDGKIVTAGSAWPSSGRLFSVSRYNEDGTLDTTFGDGGSVDTDMTGTYPKYDNYANAIAIDSQQRIIAAGQVNHASGGMDIALARYEPNGELDPSFGNGGIVITSLIPGGNNSANAVSVDSNGDILVAGVTSQPQSNQGSNFALVRYTSDGTLDTTFGGGTGWVQTDFSSPYDIAYSMALQPDGKIVLAGSADLTHPSGVGDDFALARYNTDGSLDTTFGAGTGKVTTDFGPEGYTNGTDVAYGVTVDAAGRIVAAGSSSATPIGFNDFALARYNSDGTPDTSFGSGGRVLTAASSGNSYAGPVIVTPTGKILAGGEGDVAGQNRNFMIARYNDDGSLDTTFTSASSAAPAGVEETDFGGGANGWDQIYGMALDHQGRLVAAGGTFQTVNNFDTGLARYVLDSTLSANVGGPYAVDEGSSLTLSATASGGDGGPLTYSWDVNGDGTFGDVTGANPTLTWSQLEALGIDDGPATVQVSVRVSDSHGEYLVSQPTTLTVHDIPPTASVSGPAAEVVGQPQIYSLSATDPSSADSAVGFSYLINWGDSSPTQTVAGPVSAAQLSHAFTASGSYTVDVWATDKDGQQSTSPATFTAMVSAAAMQGNSLIIGGNDVLLQPADANGGILATVDGVAQGVFYPTSQIVVYGLAGGDTIQIEQAKIGRHKVNVAVPAVVFGGDGGDTIDARGSSANNVLVGGSGNDLLYGGSGRDLLIGGGGADTLSAGSGDDLLIGGATDYDSNLVALDAIMAEWGRTDISYQQRIADLDGAASGGLNGQYLLNATTVHDDGASDQLAGGGGQDWYIASADDVVSGKKHNEVVTMI